MSKERTSITLEPEVARYLSQDHINTSGLINDLVKQYMEGGDEQASILRLREKQLRSEIQSLEQQQETKEKELERITGTREDVESGPDLGDEFDDILNRMESGEHMWESAGPIQTLATQHGLAATDVLERLKHRAADQGREITTHQFHRADRPPAQPDRPVTEVYDGDE